jgi:RNA polymerase sigma-70 factor, ECF subfamily
MVGSVCPLIVATVDVLAPIRGSFQGPSARMQPLNERELIERAQQGSQEAVSLLYEAYAQAVFRYISYRVQSDTIAEDLTADVFLLMVRGLPKFKYTGAPLGAWLFRIAANRLTDFHRKSQTQQTEALSDDYSQDYGDLLEQVASEQERSRLREALQNLPDVYQTVLILRFMQDMPHADIAQIVGKSEEAVRVIQHRALKALAATMQEADEPANGQGVNHDA